MDSQFKPLNTLARMFGISPLPIFILIAQGMVSSYVSKSSKETQVNTQDLTIFFDDHLDILRKLQEPCKEDGNSLIFWLRTQ